MVIMRWKKFNPENILIYILSGNFHNYFSFLSLSLSHTHTSVNKTPLSEVLVNILGMNKLSQN